MLNLDKLPQTIRAPILPENGVDIQTEESALFPFRKNEISTIWPSSDLGMKMYGKIYTLAPCQGSSSQTRCLARCLEG
jgi:hypothetical protein